MPKSRQQEPEQEKEKCQGQKPGQAAGEDGGCHRSRYGCCSHWGCCRSSRCHGSRGCHWACRNAAKTHDVLGNSSLHARGKAPVDEDGGAVLDIEVVGTRMLQSLVQKAFGHAVSL